jgi:hypothetical protein
VEVLPGRNLAVPVHPQSENEAYEPSLTRSMSPPQRGAVEREAAGIAREREQAA